MDTVSNFSSIVGIPSALKEILKMINNLRVHIGHIRDNPKQKTKLAELAKILLHTLESLKIEPHDSIAKLITENLRSVDESVRSVSTRDPSTWLMASASWLMASVYHARLEEAESKLQHIITQCTVLYTNQQPASTVFNINPDLPSCDVGLDRSAHILKFLKGSERRLRVIVIHGPGGIGKTTLLNRIWNDASFKALFPVRAYVQVGEHPTPEDITNLQSGICKQLDPQKKELKFPTEDFGKTALLQHFQETKKPLFLAMDNIFEVEHLRRLLPYKLTMEGIPSSTCIVITCRDRKIGNAILEICHLELENCSQVLFFEPPYLNSEQSKKFFAECARMEFPDSAHEDLIDALVPLCGGLPLALQVLGRIFENKTRRQPNEWHRIRQQWTTFDDSDDHDTSLVSKAVQSSYALLKPSRSLAFLDIVSSYYGWPWELVEGIVGEEVMKDLGESSLISKVERENECSQSALTRRRCEEVNKELLYINGLMCISGYVWVHDLTLRLGMSIYKDKVNGLCSADDQEHEHVGFVEHPFTDIRDLPEVTNLRILILRINFALSSQQLSALHSYLQKAKWLQMLIVQLDCKLFRSMITYRTSMPMSSRRHLCYFSHNGPWDEGWSKYLTKVPFFPFPSV